MTFFQLSLKMLRNNFYGYQLYFNSSCFAAAIFFCFASLLCNEQFMDGHTVDSMISSNLIFPGLLTAGFMVLFLPLSYHVFWNVRKQDYGVFLSLGMSRAEAARYIAMESLILSAFALLAAFVVGSVCSLLFGCVLKYLLHIRGWGLALPLEAYLFTGLLHAAVTLLTVAAYSVKFLFLQIGRMLKNHEKPEGKSLFLHILSKCLPKYHNRSLIRLSFLMRHAREWSVRHAMAGTVILMITLFTSLSLCMFGGFRQDAKTYAPFDMLYASVYGYNDLPAAKAAAILQREHVDVTSFCQIAFCRDAAFNYVPVSELGQTLNQDIQVAEGTFLNLFQFDMQDGYEHDISPVTSITLKDSKSAKELHSCGSKIEILWNKNPAFADRTLVLNDRDFAFLCNNEDYSLGTIKLFRFKDWQRSAGGVSAIEEYLQRKNGLPEAAQRTLAVSSRLSSEERARQSGSVLLLSMGFVIIMLSAVFFLSIHIRITGEREEHRRSIKSLYYMGCLKSQLQNMLLFKNRVHFLVPIALGSLPGIVPCYLLNQTYQFGIQAVLVCMGTGILMAIIAWNGLRPYSKREFLLMQGRRTPFS